MEMETVFEEINDIYKNMDLTYGRVKHLLQDFEDNVMNLYFKFRKILSVIQLSKLGKDEETDPECYDDIVEKVSLILEGYLCILEGYVTDGDELRTREHPQIDRNLGHVFGLSPLESKQFYQDFCKLELSNLNRIVEQSEMSMTPFLLFLVEFMRDHAQSVEEPFSDLNETYTVLIDFQAHMNIQRKDMKRRCEAIIEREKEVARRKKEAFEIFLRYVGYDSDDDGYPYSDYPEVEYTDKDISTPSSLEKSFNQTDVNNNQTSESIQQNHFDRNKSIVPLPVVKMLAPTDLKTNKEINQFSQ